MGSGPHLGCPPVRGKSTCTLPWVERLAYEVIQDGRIALAEREPDEQPALLRAVVGLLEQQRAAA